jgi:hypothetical protein
MAEGEASQAPELATEIAKQESPVSMQGLSLLVGSYLDTPLPGYFR